MKIYDNSIIAFPFLILWFSIVLPKTVQLLLWGIFSIFLVRKYGISKKCNKYEIFQLIYLLIYMLAISISLIRFEYSYDRIFATVNTFMINILGLLYYHIYRNVEFTSKEKNNICKYSFFNLSILIVLFFIYQYTHLLDNVVIFNKTISLGDYINGIATTRFVGFLDYSNMVVFVVLFLYPFAIEFVNNRIISIIFTTMLFFVINATNSRSGLAIFLPILIVFILFCTRNKKFKMLMKYKWIIVGICIGILLFVIAVNPSIIFSVFNKILHMREGSNGTRMSIYRESINKMFNFSPIIGMGIKDMTRYGYPYGSHSTYIGSFYKAGLLGGTLYVASIAEECIRTIKSKTKNKYVFLREISLLAILALMLLEDIDGTNSSMILFSIVLAINNKPNNKKLCEVK